MSALACADCLLLLDADAQSTGTPVVALDDNADSNLALSDSGAAELLT